MTSWITFKNGDGRTFVNLDKITSVKCNDELHLIKFFEATIDSGKPIDTEVLFENKQEYLSIVAIIKNKVIK